MAKLHPVEVLIREEKWPAARKAIRSALKTEPDSHWLLTRLGLTYYEQRDYVTSLKYAEQARKVAPRCPLVVWDYAGTLQILGRHREAVEAYRSLVRRGAKRIANGPCGEGLARARGLVADCHYRIAESLEVLGHRRAALAEFETHLDLRGPGCQSAYRLSDLNLPDAARNNRRPTA
jgi:tetratricopeptide (TPR) repeat protein